MNKIMLAGALALTVTLGACGTTGTQTAATIGADIKKFIQAVDARAIQVCGFLPTDGTVRAILDSASPVVGTVDGIAQAICSALKAYPLSSRRLGGAVPTVNGIVIHGRYVN